MADARVTLLQTSSIEKNPENPRLIFREDELASLQESIKHQGILVPLTVYREASHYRLLDGERRWRCALKLNLKQVPAIVQEKPDRLRNLLMMFAIHNARRDWDPLPTAYKLEEIEKELTKRNEGSKPTEGELASAASMSRGEVRRLKKLLSLPDKYRSMLRAELEKPRSKQEITVDHVLEATKAAESLRKRDILNFKEEDSLRDSILSKYRTRVIKNTVEPRKLTRLARSVARGEVTRDVARASAMRLIRDPEFNVEQAYQETVAASEAQHQAEMTVSRLIERLEQISPPRVSESLRTVLLRLRTTIDRLLG
ncbi:MAG TPA: ParB/RepB/Spo0J family partition protein [Thermoanaerobaculia bacterium]|jgi:ParB/RepB/Spo0J family partition protein